MDSTPEKASEQPCKKVPTVMGIPQSWIFYAVSLVMVVFSFYFIAINYLELQNTLTLSGKEYDSFAFTYMDGLEKNGVDAENMIETARIYLEMDAMRDRQERTNYAVAARTWSRSVTTAFGIILIFFGMIFVLSKIGESSLTKMSGKSVGEIVRFSLTTSSPGIVMIMIGALLMSIPHFSPQTISTRDGAIYVSVSHTHPE